MKITSKLLTTSAIVLLMAAPAVAQSSGEFLDDEPSDSWMDDTDDSEFDDPWADPQPERSSNNSDAKLPPMGEDVSLDQFDEFYDSLVREVDERLGQMEVTSDGEEETLQGPDVSKNQSELDQIANSQREIRMLQLKLERAKLAKELWTELSAESIDDLRANISTLESQLASIEEQHAQEVEALEAQNASTQEELEAANSELADARAEIEQLQAERDDALQSARQARQAASDAFAAQSAAMAAGPSAPPSPQASDQSGEQASGAVSAPVEPRIARPSARVQNIRLVGGRAQAEVSYPGNVSARVGIDDVLRDGSRVVSIDRTGVQVVKSGRSFSLDRGSYAQPSGEDGEDTAQSSGFNSPYSSGGGSDDFSGAGGGGGNYLEDAAEEANP